VLTVCDAVWSEYGWSRDEVLFEIPLEQLFCMYAAIAARYGNERNAPTFEEEDLLDELERHGLPPSRLLAAMRRRARHAGAKRRRMKR
jgi:hypothetical protein